MATARLTGHRIRAGTQIVANVTTAYAITAFPAQTDMVNGEQWLAPVAQGTTIPKRARISRLADGTARADGFYTWQWKFSYWTHDMLSYFLTTYLGSGVESALCTVMAYDNTDTAVYLTATVYRPQLPGDGDAVVGGWRDVIIRFSGGAIIT